MPPEPDLPERTTIYRGLPGDGLNDYIRKFSVAAAADPFGTWLIFPTNRLVRQVLDQQASAGMPIIPSRICTLSDLCQNYFDEHRTTSRLLTNGESGLLLKRVLTENKAEIPAFITRNRPSPGTIDDLRRFISVITTRKIVFPECLLDLESSKSSQIDLIIRSYHDFLLELDLLDADTILDWTIDHLSAAGTDSFGHVFVYGLFNPEPLEQDLLLALRTHSSAFSQFIPTGADPALFRKPEPWLPDTGKHVPIPVSSVISEALSGLFVSDEMIDTGGKLRITSFSSRYNETISIAGEICRIHDSGIPYSSIAVAFPDIRGQIPVVDEVFADFGIPWNSATGNRLSRSPVIGFLTSILRLVSDRYPREDVVRLVGSPYFRLGAGFTELNVRELDAVSRLAQVEGEKSGWINNLDRYLTRVSDENRKGAPPHAKETVKRVISGISRLFEDLKALEGNKTVREHRKNFSDLMDRWGLMDIPASPGRDQSREEQTSLDVFMKCLAGLDRNAGLIPDENVNAGEFLSILSTLVKEAEVPATADRSGVAVLGVRECVHEHFPVLFLAGLIEGDMPRLTTRLPFMNTRENTRMGTRTLEEILGEERYYFIAALLAGLDRLYISAPLSDGDKLLLTSAFFERVKERTKAEAWGEDPESVRVYSLHAEAIQAGTMIVSGNVCGSLALLPEGGNIDELVGRVNIERFSRRGEYDSPYDSVLTGDSDICAILAGTYGPGYIYSPTMLETYAGCPFRFFLERVIGIKPLPDVEPNLSPKDRGTAVHAVLTTFYRQWRASGKTKVTGSNIAEATDLMLRIAATELDRFSFASPLWDATRVQMTGGNHTGPGIFVRFLEKEVEEECSPLVPTHFEFSFGMTADTGDDPESVQEPVALSTGGGSEPLRIKGKIDRIDITGDGLFSIYDYKTGSVVGSKKEIESGKALQLPLYLSAFEQVTGKRGVTAGYYRIRREVENKVVLLDEAGRDLICSSRPRPAADFRELLRHSHESAMESVRKIRSGVFSLMQEEKCPNAYCEFRFVCRFDPARVFSLEGEVN